MDPHESVPALIIRRSSGSVRALCPHCLRSHLHGPGREPSRVQYRVGDCGLGSYHLVYPPTSHDGTSYGWEFDEKKRWLCAVTPNGRVQDPHDQILPRRRLLPEFDQQDPEIASELTSFDGLAEDLGEAKLSDENEGTSKKTEPDSRADFDVWFKEYRATH